MKNSPFTVESRNGRKKPQRHIMVRYHVLKPEMGSYWGRLVGKNGEPLSNTELELRFTSVMKNFRAQAQAMGVKAGTLLTYYMPHEDAIYTDKIPVK
jgi:hypothetical protein